MKYIKNLFYRCAVFRFVFIFILLSIFQCDRLVGSSDSSVGEILEQLNPDEGEAFKDIPSNDPGFVLLEDRETFVASQEQEQRDVSKEGQNQEKPSFFKHLAKIITDIFKS